MTHKQEDSLKKENILLQESELKYKLLVDSIKDYALIILDPEGIVSSWNSGAEKMKGYKPDEIIGQHFSKFYAEDAVASGFPEFELKKSLEDGMFEDEGLRLRKDGSTFWANVLITPI